MDIELLTWLQTDSGAAALAAAHEITAGCTPRSTTTAKVRDELDRRVPKLTGDQAAAVLGQVALRIHAVDKFGVDAAQMFFTRDALEQATRRSVAQHRAARLALTGLPSVIDLGCGLGGDLIELSRAGLTAAGVDNDPLRVALAEANLAALGLAGAVLPAEATALDLAPFGAVFCDPARRTGRGRSYRPEDWSPAWTFVELLLTGRAVVKAAPGIPHGLIPLGVEAEWVSDRGELKEAVLWSPALASCIRRATVLGSGGLATLTEDDDPWFGSGAPPVVEVGRFLYEPDDAVIRAGLVGAVAHGVGGGLLDAKIAYVSSDEPFITPFARSYRIIEQLPYREKALRSALRERGIGALAIKKRGIEVTPETLRKKLRLEGDRAGTLVVTRQGKSAIALLVEPVEAALKPN